MVVGRYRVGVASLWPACIYLQGHSSSNNPPLRPPSSSLDPSVPFAKHCTQSLSLFGYLHTHRQTHTEMQENSSPGHNSVCFSALSLSYPTQFLSSPPSSSLCLPAEIFNVYILWDNWEHPSFCSCLNNVIAGFIGDHYSNCSIIASTLALAAVHCLSTSRPCHGLDAAQQCVT